MRILSIGGGPAGLYFAILAKRRDPARRITVVERNAADDTFGFGVVFSNETMDSLAAADPDTHDAIRSRFVHWDDIEIRYGDVAVRSGGHGFAGLSRRALLDILQRRAADLGVELRFQAECEPATLDTAAWDLVLGADGANSMVRRHWAAAFEPAVDLRRSRYMWLAAPLRLDAFTFLFRRNGQGEFHVHAYPYDQATSTVIVETDETSWRAAGLDALEGAALRPGDNDEPSIAYLERLFADLLQGHRLIGNNSRWLRFATVRTAHWHHGNVVLLGDAAHTAHFSVGSGTKLAMEDAIALVAALDTEQDLASALAAYEAERQPVVASLQRAAQASLEWFEEADRYLALDPLQFSFSLLTRSRRITYDNLRVRDADYVDRVDRWFADRLGTGPDGAAGRNGGDPGRADAPPATTGRGTGMDQADASRHAGATRAAGAAGVAAGVDVAGTPPRTPASRAVATRPPMFWPLRLRGLTLENRVGVSPMDMYSATDGLIGDFHLVHLGSRAMGGAGLVMTEMVCVAPEARITPGCAGIWDRPQLDAWRRVVDFAHANSRARIGLQLGHAGRKGSTRLMWEGVDEPLPSGNWPIVSASPLPYKPHSQIPAELDRAGMDLVIDQFVTAARHGAEAGFDLLELHFAHGYLLASFISPLTNVRTDRYGGSLANRMRFPLELLEAVRAAWPADRPISVRISATDWHPRGLTGTDAIEAARMLEAAGCDLLDVSTGLTTIDAKPAFGRSFQTPFADRIRAATSVPIMTVGAISSPDDVNSIILAGRADLCLLGRPHLYDPHWTLHAAAEQAYDGDGVTWPVQYRAGNRPPPGTLRRDLLPQPQPQPRPVPRLRQGSQESQRTRGSRESQGSPSRPARDGGGA